MEIRNIGIIAHVDHGKTTLVDAILKQSGTFRDNEQVAERVMDSIDQERERGITIEAKNTSYFYNGNKYNIVDTPGHADFGGEVERILTMVDAVCLLVDASEGALPQTRFVLSKALQAKLKIIVIVNKIDRPDARIQEVENAIFDLFIELGAGEDQMDYPTLYTIAKDGVAKDQAPPYVETELKPDLKVLFDLLEREVPIATQNVDAPLAMLVSNRSHSSFIGRLAVGRIKQGKIQKNQQLQIMTKDGKAVKFRVQGLMCFEGLKQTNVDEVIAGDIAVVAGMDDIQIGDTITDIENPISLPRIEIDPPTVSMSFMVNTSPMAGLDGKVLLSRELLERLEKEALSNVSIKIAPAKDSANTFIVSGRGEMQLAVIIEKIRREGFEIAVGKPQAVFKVENNETLEPMEIVYIDVPDEFIGSINEMMHTRKGNMRNMIANEHGRTNLEFEVPSRGLIGFRSNFLTETRGTGILNSLFNGYAPYKGDIPSRVNGALVADRQGKSVTYGLFYLEPRGKLFIGANVAIYCGMIIGEHARSNDLYVNGTKEKKLSNMRAAGKDDMMQLSTPIDMNLERALEWIRDDELVEITPQHIRLRKRDLSVQR